MPFKLTHPESKQEIEVESSSVHRYIDQGWQADPHANLPEPPTPPQLSEGADGSDA